jgi:hypothetical protein
VRFLCARESPHLLSVSLARGGTFANLQTIPPYQHRMQSNYMLREALYVVSANLLLFL